MSVIERGADKEFWRKVTDETEIERENQVVETDIKKDWTEWLNARIGS